MTSATGATAGAGQAMPAVLVDPLDVDAIAGGIRAAIDRRDELRSAGLERATAFTWKAAADATVEVYSEAKCA